MSEDRWFFEKSRLANTPSRHDGIAEEKELAYLQQTSNFIQEMGRKLSLPLLCINTAVLFTQRFYIFHSLTVFEKYALGASALFLAAKVEEHPRKVEHVCKAATLLLGADIKEPDYIQDLLFNENALLQTLGFDLHVQHPHQHVLRLCNLVKVSKDLSQASYILATHCLHLTKMCLTYKPTVIACVCVSLACRLLDWQIPISREGKHWYLYIDASVTAELLEELSDEFLNVYSKCPDRLKYRIQFASSSSILTKLTETVASLSANECSKGHSSKVQAVSHGDGKVLATPAATVSTPMNDAIVKSSDVIATSELTDKLPTKQVIPIKITKAPGANVFTFSAISQEKNIGRVLEIPKKKHSSASSESALKYKLSKTEIPHSSHATLVKDSVKSYHSKTSQVQEIPKSKILIQPDPSSSRSSKSIFDPDYQLPDKVNSNNESKQSHETHRLKERVKMSSHAQDNKYHMNMTNNLRYHVPSKNTLEATSSGYQQSPNAVHSMLNYSRATYIPHTSKPPNQSEMPSQKNVQQSLLKPNLYATIPSVKVSIPISAINSGSYNPSQIAALAEQKTEIDSPSIFSSSIFEQTAKRFKTNSM